MKDWGMNRKLNRKHRQRICGEKGMEKRLAMTEHFKKRITEFFLTFCIATTGTVFVSAVYINIFWRGALLDPDFLWQNLLLCFVCSLCNFIHPFQESSRIRVWLNIGARYLYINVVILGSGHLFRWLDIKNILMLAVMMLEILLVFVMVSWVMWQLHKKDSERLNEKLQEYQRTGGRT